MLPTFGTLHLSAWPWAGLLIVLAKFSHLVSGLWLSFDLEKEALSFRISAKGWCFILEIIGREHSDMGFRSGLF